MTTQSPTPVLEARAVTKRYAGTTALAGVDFAVRSRAVHALIGENGAGKSTLVKILAGVEQPTSGRARCSTASRCSSTSPATRASSGSASSIRSCSSFRTCRSRRTCSSAASGAHRWGTLDRAAQRHGGAQRCSSGSGSVSTIDRRVGSLPLGQQQIVEIARALVHDVARADDGRADVGAHRRRDPGPVPSSFATSTAHGVAIVYISHRLEELLAIADTVTVLRDGVVVGEAPRADVNVAWIVERMTGRDGPPRSSTPPRSPPGSPVLAVKDLRPACSTRATGSSTASRSTLRPGEILGPLRPDGRRPDRAARVPCWACTRTRRAACASTAASSRVSTCATGSPRPRDGARRPPGVRPRADHVRAAEHDAVAPRRAGAGAAISRRRAKQPSASEWGSRLRIKTPAPERRSAR